MIRAIYCCIDSVLLWYNLFSLSLESLGFGINPYDRCVSKKVIEVTQCTISGYVDANKLLHKNPDMIYDIINEANNGFGELSVVKGNKHNFLVINI